MIHFLKGTIIAIDGCLLTIDVHGVGFAVHVPQALALTINTPISLHVFFHWHQDNGPQLFGFQTAQERQLFTLLLSCSGIGPKMALSLLALDVKTVSHAIITGDCKTLSSIPGVGPKKAELIIMHLKGKIEKFFEACPAVDSSISVLKDVSEALGSLGYSRAEVMSALDNVRSSMQSGEAFDVLLKRALAFLMKKK